ATRTSQGRRGALGSCQARHDSEPNRACPERTEQPTLSHARFSFLPGRRVLPPSLEISERREDAVEQESRSGPIWAVVGTGKEPAPKARLTPVPWGMRGVATMPSNLRRLAGPWREVERFERPGPAGPAARPA